MSRKWVSNASSLILLGKIGCLAWLDSLCDELVIPMADFFAGCVYDWRKRQDASYRLIEKNMGTVVVRTWPDIKEEWIDREKQKTRRPD